MFGLFNIWKRNDYSCYFGLNKINNLNYQRYMPSGYKDIRYNRRVYVE